MICMVSKVFHRCKPLKINGNVHSFIHKPRWICDLKSLHATSNLGDIEIMETGIDPWKSEDLYPSTLLSIAPSFQKAQIFQTFQKDTTMLGVFRAKPRYLKKGHSKIISTSGLLHLLTLKDRHQMPGCQFRDTKESWALKGFVPKLWVATISAAKFLEASNLEGYPSSCFSILESHNILEFLQVYRI